MRAAASRKPKAWRMSNLILVLVDSTSVLDRPRAASLRGWVFFSGLLGSRWKPFFPPVFHHALRTPRVAEARGGVPLYIGLQLVPVA